jgi:hypothetical protein
MPQMNAALPSTRMASDYSVHLTARQEGVEYRSAGDVYRFDVLLLDGEWELYLPCSRGDARAPHELTEAEAAEILPRIVDCLAHDRMLGGTLRTYPVRIVRGSR